ncbi:MAG: PRC-barrel domain-containing protein [Solirubrobacteraceae bacterium]
MTAPIEDVSTLPGKKITDQAENPLGKVKEIYATDGYPMWVAVEMSSGLANKRTVFIPLARIKDEDGELRVPYSAQRIGDAPEVDEGDGISAECDRRLRDYYGIDTGDQELRSDNKSYATLVPDEGGEAQRVENADELDTPDADTRTDESHERLRDPGSSEMRHVTAEDVAHNTQGSGDDSDRESPDEDRESGDEDTKSGEDEDSGA